MNGLWSEQESHIKLKEELDELDRLYPDEQSVITFKRNYWNQQKNLERIKNSEHLHEREYHFDENLGVSLEEHVE